MKKPVVGRPVRVQNLSRYIPMDCFYRMCSKIPAKYEKYLLNFLMIRFMTRRPCETVAVNLMDMIYERKAINMMMGKTNIITEVAVPDWLWNRLMVYIERNKHTFVNGYIFPAEKSTSDYLKVDTLSRYFRCLMDEEGLTIRIPGKQSHTRLHRFYDLVMSGTTDVIEISDENQGILARRHTDGRAIKHYKDFSRLSDERRIFNTIANRYADMTKPSLLCEVAHVR